MAQTKPTRENTCAVIVTYQPDECFSDYLQQVIDQFPLVIIIDNGSGLSAVKTLRRQSVSPCVVLAENPRNLGVATALNQGIALALQKGFQWVVTLDQDTHLHSNFLTSLFDVHLKSGGGNVMVGSNYLDVNRRRNFVQCAEIGGVFQERKTLITSGTLTPLSLFKKIGLFREDYFIDSVDHEFSLRARSHGYRMLISCQPLMDHSIGDNVDHASKLRQLLSFSHSPTRKYYIARNIVATVKTYFRSEPLWSMRQGWRLLSDFLSVLLFEHEKRKKIIALMVGVAHGVTGKMGPIEKAWQNGVR